MAHDIEVMVANNHDNSFDFPDSMKDKAEFKRNVRFSKNLTKEVMSIFDIELIRVMRNSKLEDKGSHPVRM